MVFASPRVAAVDQCVFPAGVRQRVSAARPALSEAQLATVEAAARQWFRLFARRPSSSLAVPSVLVGDWWREFVRHEREYAAFVEAAVGRALPYSDAAGTIAATYREARRDEKADLPLIFRVDQEAGVPDARRYLADCGGRGQCFDVAGVVCLQHLGGPGRATRGDFKGPPGAVDLGSDIGGGL